MMNEHELNDLADTFCWLQNLTFEQFVEAMSSNRMDIKFKQKGAIIEGIRRYIAVQQAAEKTFL